MRERWGRRQPTLDVSTEDVAVLVPERTVVSIAPAAGGLANTNLRVDTTTGPILLRLWTRDPRQAAKEVALLALVADRVPVPRVLHTAPDNPITGHPIAVMEWIDAPRLEETDTSPALARDLGRTLAAIHSFTFPRTGFLDARLDVVEPVPIDGAGVLAFLRATLVDGPHLDAALVNAVLRTAERDGALLDAWTGPPSLTHSDFNGSNVLVRGDAVAAVLDWEFAFSGVPFVDFGNLLRPPRGDDDAVAAAVAEGYGALPRAWRRMSQLADLMAWAEFLSRPNPGPALVADARIMFQRFVSGA